MTQYANLCPETRGIHSKRTHQQFADLGSLECEMSIMCDAGDKQSHTASIVEVRQSMRLAHTGSGANCMPRLKPGPSLLLEGAKSDHLQ
jgi:hypothetical protein